MSIKNLDILFNPKRIAVIGASENDKSAGYHLLKNLIGKGFKGIVHPVHPTMRGIQGVEAYKSIGNIPHPIDLAMVATDPDNLPTVLRDCAQKGVKGVTILGPDSSLQHSTSLSEHIRKLSSSYGCRVIGPNSLGFLRPALNLNASLYPEIPQQGNIAFISESGGFSAIFLEHAIKKNVGFSYFVSLGSKRDVNFADIIDFLGRDGSTTSLFLHVQSINNGRRFMTALRNYATLKPIVILKTGQSETCSLQSITDCGCLASEDLIYEAVFKRAGSLRVNSIVDLLDMVETIAKQDRPKGRRLMVIANSIAPSEIAVSALQAMGGLLAVPGMNTLQSISDQLEIKRELSNPLHLRSNASAADYQVAISACLKDKMVDGVLVICIPFPGIDLQKIAEAIVSAAVGNPKTPLFTTWCGEESSLSVSTFLNSKNVPTYYTPEQAIKSFMYMYRYDYNLKLLQETPEILLKDFSPDLPAAKKIIQDCLAGERFILFFDEAAAILAAYGIQAMETVGVSSAEEASRVASRLGYPAAMRIYSPNAGTKCRTDRVVHILRNDHEVREAFSSAYDLVISLQDPDTALIIQPMPPLHSYTLAIGAQKNRSFGTTILFGLGGNYLQAEKDYAIGLPPLNQTLARRLMEETKIYRHLKEIPSLHRALGYLEELLVRFSQLLIDLPQIGEIELNPLLLTENEGVVGSVSIHLDRDLPRKYRWTRGDLCPLHLSIPPYPFKYEKNVTLKDGTEIHIRPIRGEDESAMRVFFESLSEESVFYRFGQRRINIPHTNLARFCQVDYDRDLAFLAVARGQEEIVIGDMQLHRFVDLENAEFSLTVADTWQGMGIGRVLMDYCIAVAGDIGIKTLWMDVIKDNWRMIKFGTKYNFKRLAGVEEDDMVEMVLDIRSPDEASADDLR
ncbi:MAG: bifunctional acetate--CoA ligase family protein/GNAT family N-acetyltransferase [Proteobacteria bacterium]|nr:bifunctional acetate--CoA ligase family protein/GNAT family N-acetyltransferase [Pseudomonadota bacterium]